MASLLAPVGRLVSGAVPPALRRLDRQVTERLEKAALERNGFGYDPYGFHPAAARSVFLVQALLYRHYFRAETTGIENVPTGRVLLIANHAGQFGWDGAMLAAGMLLDAAPPRIARGMGEYFLFKLPWVGIMGARMGMMVGTPANCVHMLEHEQCVMVFPEGARGANKPFTRRYQLQRFGSGFMRLALQTQTPIVPVGIDYGSCTSAGCKTNKSCPSARVGSLISFTFQPGCCNSPVNGGWPVTLPITRIADGSKPCCTVTCSPSVCGKTGSIVRCCLSACWALR